MGPAGERPPSRQLHGKAESQGEGKRGGGNEGDGKGSSGGRVGEAGTSSTSGDEETTWAKVVRGPKGKRQVVPEESTGKGSKGSDRRPEEEGADDAEEDLPPQRTFVTPGESREAILRKSEAAAARARRAKERGAKDEKIRQAEAAAQEWAKRLRESGGASPTTLLFQIRGEEKKKQNSIKAIEQVERQIAEEEEEIQRRRLEIQRLHRAAERLMG